jgi:TetR/AcrR family transcriptional regulator, mexJK operon transcriptional repressor
MRDVGAFPVQIIEPQSARGKARLARMLEVAAELFLRDGYEQTSIDAILVRSGGSKATLYAYFPTKEDLFRAVIDSVVINDQRPADLDPAAEARVVLTEFAVARLHVMLSPQHRAILGLIIAERERFPDLARMYQNRGPQRSQALLVTYLEALRRNGQLELADVNEAAEFFIGMLKQRWNSQLLFVAAPAPSDTAIREHSERVVIRFLAAFGRHTH